jgi:hypothetical protein
MFGGIFLAKVPKPGGMLEGKYRAFFCLTAFSSHLLTPFKGGEFNNKNILIYMTENIKFSKRRCGMIQF